MADPNHTTGFRAWDSTLSSQCRVPARVRGHRRGCPRGWLLSRVPTAQASGSSLGTNIGVLAAPAPSSENSREPIALVQSPIGGALVGTINIRRPQKYFHRRWVHFSKSFRDSDTGVAKPTPRCGFRLPLKCYKLIRQLWSNPIDYYYWLATKAVFGLMSWRDIFWGHDC